MINWDITRVPPELFAGSLSSLQTVRFCSRSRVTPSQLESLLLMISSQEEAGGSTLKHLRFDDIDLTSVSPEVLVGAIQKLEKVAFYVVKMTVPQITAILTMLKENKQGGLEDVVIMGPSILGGSVSPTLLQEARLNSTVYLDLEI